MIDVHNKSSESGIESLAEKRMNKPTKGYELSKLPVGTPILYDLNPDNTKIKCIQKGEKVLSKDRLNGRKYEILTNNDRIITRSRRHIKGYRTRSSRISTAPDRFGDA